MTPIARQFGRSFAGISAATLALACSACSTLQSPAMKAADKGAVHAIYQEPPHANNARAARKAHESDIQQLGDQKTAVQTAAAGVTQIRRDSAIQQMSYTEEAGGGLQQASGMAQPFENPCPPGVIQQCPPEPRWAAAGPNPMAAGMMACDVCNSPSMEKYPDEYLCDGGDRGWPVHYDQYNRRSLDTEDTIIEYTDHTGKERMKPSNQVCVYAPRFASVRTVSRPHEESGSNEVGGIGHLATTSGMNSRLKASNSTQRQMMQGVTMRSRAGGLDMEEGQGLVSQLRAPSVHDKLLNVYQSLTFVRLGRVDDADSARLNYGIQAASLWTREQFPVMTAKTDMVLEGKFLQAAASITGIDDEKKSDEDLRIVKLANKKTATPGEEIEFTIRYDNLGGTEVFHVRIVDNLTPRLAYIEESATSDRNGRLVLQDNGEGSNVLVWELDDPLPAKTGGTVTFKARVR